MVCMSAEALKRGILLTIIGLFASSVLFLMSATFAHAQEDLSATIRAAILSDPRSQGMSQEQLNALVQALTKQAQAQGVSSHDITWRPQVDGFNAQNSMMATEDCGSVPEFACHFNEMIGFSGSNWYVSMFLLLGLMTLILILAMMIEHSRRK